MDILRSTIYKINKIVFCGFALISFGLYSSTTFSDVAQAYSVSDAISKAKVSNS
jgi:hypothetical protein